MDNSIRHTKKPWQKPELIVLARSKPEETVLTACKVRGSMGPVLLNKACNRASCGGVCSSAGKT